MEERMQAESSRDRGRFWPVLFAVLGALNLVAYLYKYSFQIDDLLQGIGFLLIVPLAYLVPAAFSFEPRSNKLQIRPWIRGAAGAGALLVAVGLAIQWGWL